MIVATKTFKTNNKIAVRIRRTGNPIKRLSQRTDNSKLESKHVQMYDVEKLDRNGKVTVIGDKIDYDAAVALMRQS